MLQRLVLACWLVCPAGARAQAVESHASGFTLAEALHAMRSAHPALARARYEIAAARGDAVDARLWTNPQLDGWYNRATRNSSYDPAGYVTYSVTQFIEAANAPGLRGRAARQLLSASRADYRSTEVTLSLDVESAMITASAAAQRVRNLERAYALLEEVQRIVHDRVRAGAAPEYDASRIDVTLALSAADLSVARAELARARGELDAAIGPASASLHGEPRYALEDAPRLPSVEELVSILAEQRPDLAAARLRAQSARTSVSVARRSVLPGFALRAGGGYGAAPGQLDVSVGLSLSLPVTNRGQGAIPAAHARARAAEASVLTVLLPAELRLRGMHAEVLARRKALVDFSARGVAAGETMLEQARAGYLAGRFSVLELADAYASWREARLRAIELAARARSSEVELGRAIGTPLREL